MNVRLKISFWLTLTGAALLTAGCSDGFPATPASLALPTVGPTPAILTFPTLTRPTRVPTATRTPTPVPATPVQTIQLVGHDEVAMVEIPAGEFTIVLGIASSQAVDEWQWLRYLPGSSQWA